jgi:hypothetical protein
MKSKNIVKVRAVPVLKHHTTRHEGVTVKVHIFLASALNGDEWPASCSLDVQSITLLNNSQLN